MDNFVVVFQPFNPRQSAPCSQIVTCILTIVGDVEVRRRVLVRPHLSANLAINKADEMFDEVSAGSDTREKRR